MALSQETAVAMVALVVAVPQAIVVVWAWWTKCRCMLARNQSTDGKPARESPRQAGKANSCVVVFSLEEKSLQTVVPPAPSPGARVVRSEEHHYRLICESVHR